MANDTNQPIITAEPEERIEAALIAKLAAVCTLPIDGALEPAAEGTVKHLSGDTFISVVVDQVQQGGDYTGPFVPYSYEATVKVHYSLADDPNAAKFRDECRRVRAVLTALTGDGCANLGAVGYRCDRFTLGVTQTPFDMSGDNPTNTKTYTATIGGCVIRNKQTEA